MRLHLIASAACVSLVAWAVPHAAKAATAATIPHVSVSASHDGVLHADYYWHRRHWRHRRWRHRHWEYY